MKLDKNIARLISEIEYQIGSHCYNPNSYDGYTGEEGKYFRYPVYTTSNSKEKKHYEEVNLSPDEIPTLKYKFGSNHLLIGIGIICILWFLESRYGISFNELEEKVNKS